MITTIAFVFAAGCGAVARALLGASLNQEDAVPWGTFVANVSGSFALGLLVGLDAPVVTVLGTGFLGAYTTLSSFVRDVVALQDRGRTTVAILYLLLTCGASVGAAAGGLALS